MQPTKWAPYSIGSDTLPGLSKLIEECGEVIQVAGKLIATWGRPMHWSGETLNQRMIEELGDLQAALLFYCGENGGAKMYAAVGVRSDHKLVQFRQWHSDGQRAQHS